MALVMSLILILSGMVVILIMEGNVPASDQATAANTEASGASEKVLGALFQSVTARTAGFNTVDVSSMSPASKLALMTLMFIGGSPGSTAGGIKTVTLAVIIMVAYATFRKRQRVEVFKRSVSNAVVGRAIAVTFLFAAVLIFAVLALSLTERENAAEMGDIAFEAASALGTVGLSTGITGSLTTAGKLIIIVVMLIGRLGPLTLLAAITFNMKPVGYSYPDEPIIVG